MIFAAAAIAAPIVIGSILILGLGIILVVWRRGRMSGKYTFKDNNLEQQQQPPQIQQGEERRQPIPTSTEQQPESIRIPNQNKDEEDTKKQQQQQLRQSVFQGIDWIELDRMDRNCN